MNLLELAAKITLDSSEYNAGLDEASKKASSFGSTIKNGLGVAAKAGAAAIGAASAGIAALVKSSVSAYAEQEQLIGGVETLFGDSAGKVIADSQAAFKTAGMSMNDYMETSIQSAAALINSLDGDQAKAADLMNMSIVDMADNVNKMGTTMESVQNAYRGFSRGNFTMLDNLALGFAGTKEGMQELLDKAEELEAAQGRMTKYSIESYADIVQAIHVVQDEMGISGTTSKEASSTISGSLSMVKAAWANLITGVADENADFDTLIGNFVESVSIAGENIVPRVEQAMVGVGKLVTGLAPVIAEALPSLITEVLPSLIDSAQTLVLELAEAIARNMPILLQTAGEVATKLLRAITETIADLAKSGALTEMMEAGVALVGELLDALTEAAPIIIPALADIILEIVDFLTNAENTEKLSDAGIELLTALAVGLISAIPEVLARIPQVYFAILKKNAETLPKFYEAGGQILLKLGEGIVASVGAIVSTMAKIYEEIFNPLVNAGKNAITWGKDLIGNFINGIGQMWDKLKQKVSDVGQLIKDFLGFSEPDKGPLSNFHTYAPDMMRLFAQGITENKGLVTSAIDDAFDIQPSITGALSANAVTTGGGMTYSGDRSGRSEAVMEVDRTVFARLIYRLYNEEASRVGVNVTGVMA